MDTWNEDTTIDFIANYLVKVVQAYTNNGKFNSLKYFTEVFIHIADIWGFLTCYGTIIEHLYLNYASLNNSEQILFNKLKSNVLTYIYYAHASPNDITQLYSKLIPELYTLNPLFLNCSKLISPVNFSRTATRMPSLLLTKSITKQLSQKWLSKIKR